MKKILIIEDDQLVANIYRNKLAVEGFQVEVALTGEDGCLQMVNDKPDVIILDLSLPKMTGIEVLKKIRSEALTEKIPVIVFSNTYLTRLVEEAWKSGATKCLSKSNCSPKEVLDAVRSTLGVKIDTAPKDQTQFEPRAKIALTQKLTESQTEFRTAMNSNFPQRIAMIRASIQALAKATTDAEKAKLLSELVQTIHKVTNNASVSGLGLVAQLSEAVEAMLTEFHQKPSEVTPSAVRTLANAVDFLPALFDHVSLTGTQCMSNSNILVVDDEPIARRAVTHALERAKLKSTAVDDASSALQMLQNHTYDLVFLDVDMPQINGHELCSKLRALPSHKFTPVVFVTSNTELSNRASSMISGGNDFIGKPFHFLELAVKSLVYVMKAKVQPQKVAV